MCNKSNEERKKESNKQKTHTELLMSLYQLEYNKNESAILNTKKDWFTIYVYWKSSDS